MMGTFTRRSPDGMLIETYHDGYEVNAVGAFIWSRVGSGATVAEITAEVGKEYELDPAPAARVVEEFLAELVERGFVVRD
jgi:hypothetical protein